MYHDKYRLLRPTYYLVSKQIINNFIIYSAILSPLLHTQGDLNHI